MADDFRGKAVMFVALGVGRSVHVWLPVLISIGYGGDIIRVIMSEGRTEVNKLTKPQQYLCRTTFSLTMELAQFTLHLSK
jgi:hypothetical protein